MTDAFMGNINSPIIDDRASFVEYLRWMRVDQNDRTVIELFECFKQKANLSKDLERLNDRTKLLADECFEACCPWRIRVGGTRGPKKVQLLPAFDALGIPYIPSSTLKGIARAIASKEIPAEEVDSIFGTISLESSRMGQVVFLDAYPTDDNKLGNLQLDIANQIWKWKGTELKYDTNPNILISLEKPKFIIGLRRGVGCDNHTLSRVSTWLKRGLAEGIGSRVNTGYGTLNTAGVKQSPDRELFRLPFELEGQLIHGHHNHASEIRPTAFRSMLRYWFRALALGVLSSTEVRKLELEIFGGIEPDPYTGNFRLEVKGEIEQEPSKNLPGLASGWIIFRRCPQATHPVTDHLKSLLLNLTWLMFNLGGIGLGARRPCHKRTSRPYWRGTTLTTEFWQRHAKVKEFQIEFVNRMAKFYKLLGKLISTDIDPSKPNIVLSQPTETKWAEAIDDCCRIVCVSGPEVNRKPFALARLHDLAREGQPSGEYNSALCGNSNETPSPIWIAKIGYYQVVTVFGSSEKTRKNYLKDLYKNSIANKAGDFKQLWPLPQKKDN